MIDDDPRTTIVLGGEGGLAMEAGPLAYCSTAAHPVLVDGFIIVPNRGLVRNFLADALLGGIAGGAGGSGDRVVATDDARRRGRGGDGGDGVILGGHGGGNQVRGSVLSCGKYLLNAID